MSQTDDLKNAAAKFRQRRSINPGRASSLRKIIRALRIEAGTRPLHQPMRFTLSGFFGDPAGRQHRDDDVGPTFARLHPTKGWRFGNAI